jgi:hypothetical protein
LENLSLYLINLSSNLSYVSVDFSSDIMATSLDFRGYGTNLAPNSTFYNDSYTPTLCVVYDITTTYYTPSTSPRISSRPTTLFNQPNIHAYGRTSSS